MILRSIKALLYWIWTFVQWVILACALAAGTHATIATPDTSLPAPSSSKTTRFVIRLPSESGFTRFDLINQSFNLGISDEPPKSLRPLGDRLTPWVRLLECTAELEKQKHKLPLPDNQNLVQRLNKLLDTVRRQFVKFIGNEEFMENMKKLAHALAEVEKHKDKLKIRKEIDEMLTGLEASASGPPSNGNSALGHTRLWRISTIFDLTKK